MTVDVVKFLRDEAAGWDHIEHVHDAIVGLADKLEKTLETEYAGALYRTDYSVTGRGAFPVDMLRYTRSWPATEADVGEIERSIELAGCDDAFTVRLTKHHRDPDPGLEEERWRSKFKWKLVGNNETTEV